MGVGQGLGRWDESEAEEHSGLTEDQNMIMNLGPQHPSTHGVLRVVLELEGETIRRSRPVIGYLHTGMEKTGEQLTYLQGPTNVTRMAYAAPLFNETVFSLATEELLGVEVANILFEDFPFRPILSERRACIGVDLHQADVRESRRLESNRLPAGASTDFQECWLTLVVDILRPAQRLTFDVVIGCGLHALVASFLGRSEFARPDAALAFQAIHDYCIGL